MRYFANPSTAAVRDAMTTGLLNMIATPKQGQAIPAGATWCADNGCFGKGYPGDDAWFAWLQTYTPEERARCTFAVAPDVVGDAAATLTRSAPWLPKIRALGYPAAFVAQNGLEDMTPPWDDFDVLFIGGSLECERCRYVRPASDPRPEKGERPRCVHCNRVLTEWKLSSAARQIVRQAKRRGKWVHMGRVNSARRTLYADAIGCDSADGTHIARGPDQNLPKVLGWLRSTNDQLTLDLGSAS